MSELAGRFAQPEQAPMLPGFSHINRYWDRDNEAWVAKILPGEYYVTCANEAIGTILGSCVSACVRDPVRKIGGMNHFMLPEDNSGGQSAWLHPGLGRATRYGSFAMEQLINDLLKLGAQRDRLELKLFGGGKILASMTDVGARNIVFIRNFVRLEGFRVLAEDLGDIYPRKLIYFPQTGRVLVRKLRALDSESVATRERQYLGSLDNGVEQDDDIVLFD